MGYKIVYSTKPDLYKIGSPVVIQSGALVINNESGQLHIQIKFKNIANKVIKMLKAEIVMQDVAGRELGRGEKQYLDLNVKNGASFAGQEPIYLKDKTVRKFVVNVTEVYFVDGGIYNGNNDAWEQLPTQQSITTKFINEALDEYKAVYCKDAKFLPLIHKDVWLCSCGEVNANSRKVCCKCNAGIDVIKELDASALRLKNIYKKAISLIKENNSVRIEEGIKKLESILNYKDAKEKIDEAKKKLENVKKAEKETQLLNAKKKKKNKIIAISSLCAVISIILLITLTVNVFIPNSKFKKAQDLLNDKKYNEAYLILSELVIEYDNYKDAYGVLCENKFARANEYINNGEDKLAYQLLKNITKYKTSSDLIEEIQSRAINKAMQLAEKQDFASAVTILNDVGVTKEDFSLMKAYNAMLKHDFKTAVNEGIINFVIPDGETSIGNDAFRGCSRLTSIEIPDSVTSIGYYAFYGCSGLTSVNYLGTIDQWVQIDFDGYYSNPLYYAKKLYINGKLVTQVNLTTATSIGDYAFAGCSSLTSIKIPNFVTSIGNGAFAGCSGLTSIEISKSVTSIGNGAFSGCSSLKEITIPFVGDKAGKTSSDKYQYPFGYIFGTSSYTGGTKTKQYYYGSSTDSTTYDYYYIPSSLKKVTVTGGNILYGAFSNCSGLNSVVIPDSVTTIDYSVFYNCSSLNSVEIPNSVTSICSSAFAGCSGLTSVVIPSKVTSIGSSAFSGCRGLTSVVIPDSVTSIGSSAFSGCSSLKEITIPFVGDKAGKTSSDKYQYPFGYIFDTSSYTGGTKTKQYYYGSSTDSTTYDYYYIPTSLKNVTVTGGNILYGAFYNCSGLTSVVIGDSVTSIGNYAFAGCSGLTSVVIGNSITSIGNCAFDECSGLTSVVIGESVTSIGSYAFDGCSGLTRVNYLGTIDQWVQIDLDAYHSNPLYYAKKLYINGELVTQVNLTTATSIGDYAFYNCSGLTYVVIPNSVTSIGYCAFGGCSSLTSIEIPESVTSIGYAAFYRCSSLKEITIPFVGATKDGAENTYFGYIFGASYSSSNSSYVPNSLKKVTITGGSIIDSSAFDECSGLTSVVIGDAVTSIGYCAFDGCSSLTSVIIGDAVTSIGKRAFFGCSSLTSVVIPSKVTSIGNDAFYNCSGLTSVVIGESVTSIGSYAFEGCSGLKSITFEDTSTWYRVYSSTDWKNKTGGTQMNVTNSSQNVTSFKSYYYYYWYKKIKLYKNKKSGGLKTFRFYLLKGITMLGELPLRVRLRA